ncbi:MAG TPA: hypothetical protein PLR20_15230 [Syntrophales bacterium]|nr:hypothetical protein [Syntrophales bacterium]
MRKILIAAVLVLILPVLASSAWAVNWVEIGGNIQIDKDTIRRSGDGSVWAVWVRYQSDGGYSMARLGIYPGSDKVWVESVVSFDGNNNFINQVDLKEWMNPIPGSRLEHIRRFVTEVEKEVRKNSETSAPEPELRGEVEQ